MLQNTSQEHLVLQIQLSTNNLPWLFLRGRDVSPDCRGDKQVHKIQRSNKLPPWWSAVVALSCLPGQCQYFGSSLCWSPTEPAGSVSMAPRFWNEAEVLEVWFPLAESAIPWPCNFRGRCCCRPHQDRESDNLAHTLVHLRVQRFLGVASYHWYFIRDFAQIAKPLHSLTEHVIESSTGPLTVN